MKIKVTIKVSVKKEDLNLFMDSMQSIDELSVNPAEKLGSS